VEYREVLHESSVLQVAATAAEAGKIASGGVRVNVGAICDNADRQHVAA
jgi:hypothetical protein